MGGGRAREGNRARTKERGKERQEEDEKKKERSKCCDVVFRSLCCVLYVYYYYYSCMCTTTTTTTTNVLYVCARAAVSMGVPSDGSYGIERGLMYSFPVVCHPGGTYKIVQVGV